MLYQEFIEGTGCRENDHNYQVYKELEIIYEHGLFKTAYLRYGEKAGR